MSVNAVAESMSCKRRPSQAPSGARSLDDADWVMARHLATEADEATQHGDLYSVYVQARSLEDQGNCAAAIEIYEALLEAQPYFLPAAEQNFVCA